MEYLSLKVLIRRIIQYNYQEIMGKTHKSINKEKGVKNTMNKPPKIKRENNKNFKKIDYSSLEND